MGFGDTDAGGKVLKIDFGDPKKITLGKFFKQYAEAKYPETSVRIKPTSVELKQGKSGKLKYLEDRKKYLNDMSKIKELKPYLDKPMHELYKISAKDPSKNPLKLFRDRSVKESIADSSVLGYRKFFSAIQDNYTHGIANYGGGSTKLDLKANNKNIKDGVVFPPKAKPKATKFGIDWAKAGDVQRQLAMYGANNLQDAEIVQALLLMTNTGLRDNEIYNMKIGSLVGDGPQKAFVIFDAKASEFTDLPAGGRGLALFHQQLDVLKKTGANLADDTFLFPNVQKGDLSRVLKAAVKIPKLRQIKGKFPIEYVDYFDDPYDLRRMFLTYLDSLPSISVSAMEAATGRRTTAAKAAGTSIGDYPAHMIGKGYPPEAYQAINEVDKEYTKQLQKFIPDGQMKSNHRIDMNVNLIGVAQGNTTIKIVPDNQNQVIKNLVQPNEITITGEEDTKAKIPVDNKPPNVDDVTDYDTWIDTDFSKPSTRKNKLEGFGRFGAITIPAALGVAGFVGEKLLGVIPPAAAAYEGYDSYVNKQLSATESVVRGLSEFLPVSAADIDDAQKVGQFIKENKDFYEQQNKQGFIDIREKLRIRNQPVQSEEEQSFLSEGQQQLK